MARHRVKRAAAALTLGLAVLPGAAEAQFFGNWGGWDNGGTWDGMAPQQVRRAITEHGFRVLSPLRRNGNVFVADVLDRRGHHERLIVAAADAQILQRFLVDDGRQPGAFARGDDGDGLVPPADIPDAGRRYSRPLDRDVPPQRFGDLGTDDGSGDAGAAVLAPPTLRRAAPPIKTVKPRLADRSPDVAAPQSEPGAVHSTPLAPVAPRPVVAAPAPVTQPAAPSAAPAPVAKAAPAPAVAVSRREPVPAVPAASAPAATPARRPSDPLAIPGSADSGTKPVRSVASGITGTPAASSPAAAPPKAADVPVAPLD